MLHGMNEKVEALKKEADCKFLFKLNILTNFSFITNTIYKLN